TPTLPRRPGSRCWTGSSSSARLKGAPAVTACNRARARPAMRAWPVTEAWPATESRSEARDGVASLGPVRAPVAAAAAMAAFSAPAGMECRDRRAADRDLAGARHGRLPLAGRADLDRRLRECGHDPLGHGAHCHTGDLGR